MRKKRQEEIEQMFGDSITNIITRFYYEEENGVKATAKILGVSDRVLWDWMECLGMPRRERSDAVGLQWVDNDERRQEQSARIKAEFEDGRRDPLLLVRVAKTPWARKRNSQSKIGENNPMYGLFGELSPNWQGGKITYRGKGWKSIRTQIIRRDGCKCQLCENTKQLEVHHIVPYRETQDNSFENLITLCRPCHAGVEYGKLSLEDCPQPQPQE